MLSQERRSWWGWAVGLAIVVMALGVWGLLGGPSALAQEGGGDGYEMIEMTPEAYAANAWWVSWWGHASMMKGLIDNLGYTTLKDEPPTKASAVAAAPGRLVWYSFSHGGMDETGKYALWFGWTGNDPLNAEDLPADLHYTLVFANACKSYSEGSAFAAAFGADAYVGWKNIIGNAVAVNFAIYFMEALKGRTTVGQAVTAAINSFEVGSLGYQQVVFNIKVLRGASVVVDLSPN